MKTVFNPITGNFDYVGDEKNATAPVFDADESGSRSSAALLTPADFKMLCTEDAIVVFKDFTFPNIITSVRETVRAFGLKVNQSYYLPLNPEGTILEDHIYVENGSYKVKAKLFKCSADRHCYKIYNNVDGQECLLDLTARTENILPFSRIVTGSFRSFSDSMADDRIAEIVFAPTYNRFLAVTGTGYYTQWRDDVYLCHNDYNKAYHLYRSDSQDLYYKTSSGLALIGNLPMRSVGNEVAGSRAYTISPDYQYHIDHKINTPVTLNFMTSVPVETFSGKLRFSVFIDGRKTAPVALHFLSTAPILWNGGDVPVINPGEVLWIEGEYHDSNYGYKEDANVLDYQLLTLSYKKFRS